LYIRSLALSNFRNYKEAEIEFSPGTNIIYGSNAQGKTNILEAVFTAITTKSHRGSRDQEMIRFNEDSAHIRLIISKRNVDRKIDIHMKKGRGKGIAIDGIGIRKISELMGLANVICFSPEDLSMIKSGPAGRRRFMDLELCQLDGIYLHKLSAYNKLLAQRNALLKQIYFKPELADTLDVWDDQLVSYGSEIISIRSEFLEKLGEIIRKKHLSLTRGNEDLSLIYNPSAEKDEFKESLKAHRETDLKMKMTGVGPHRDDFSFFVGDIDLRKFGSQGQQRTAALSLKLSELELVRERIGDSPVLLLDDVLSELDSNRQNDLLESIEGIQTIITCTGLDEFVQHRFGIDRTFKVEDGHIHQDMQ